MKTALNALGRALPEFEEDLQNKVIDLNEKTVDFRISHSDSGHIIVSRFLADGSKEVIGHVYTEIDGDEIKYYCTNRRGREIFPPTTDFNKVDKRYQRYAHVLTLQERTKQLNRKPLIINNLNLKNSNTMTTPNNNPEQKSKKFNQLIFVEYEKAAGDGHLVTVMDSYRNVIGRIHRSYDNETKKYEYAAYDHAGAPMFQNDKLWQAKNEFVNNREQLLEQAHQRRIESKGKAKEDTVTNPDQEQQKTKPVDRTRKPLKSEDKVGTDRSTRKSVSTPAKMNEKTTEAARNNGSEKGNELNGKQSQQEAREEELGDLRYEQGDHRGDIDFDR
jgi:hypothetical protein